MVDKGGDVGAISGKELALLPSSSSAGPSSASYPGGVAVSADAASVNSKFYVYPPPLAKYEDIIADPNVFMTTLEKLHATMRTKFMVPIIGGKELDLHKLFVEVTARGGIEKVVRERRWKEITSVFKFPSTATNASFILRKYYVALIHHYEQLYYFGAKGWNRPETDPLPSPSPAPNPVQSSVPPVTSSEVKGSSVQPQSRVIHPLGSPVVGVIDGKFEHGYLVTISVGSQELRGVLYHISDRQTSQAPAMSPFLGPNNSGKVTLPSGVRRRRRRKKSEIKKRDPAHPKPNRSGYNFFFQEHHARLKPLHPGKDREISKMIGELWSKLTETEKAVYQERGLRDKERYQFEMQEYRERLKRSQIISDAVPIQQRHAEPEVGMTEQDPKMEVDEDKLEGEEDESEEEDPMEEESPHTPENESISAGSESQEKTAEKNTEMEVAAETGNMTESGNGATEDNDFELRKREQKDGAEANVQDLNL